MLNLIISIPGPTFLIIFSCIAAIFIIAAYRLVDHSKDFPLPEANQFDYISITALRGGWQAVIRVVVFKLWQQGVIEIIQTESDSRIATIEQPKEKLDEIEGEIYNFVAKEPTPEMLFSNSLLAEKIKENLVGRYDELERYELKKSTEQKFHSWFITLAVLALIIGVGGIKLYLGINRDKPVLYLAFLLMLFSIFTLVILQPNALQTRLGKLYLKKLEEHFGWLKNDLIKGEQPEGMNPHWAVAIFGIGFLEQGLMYTPFNQAFQKSRVNSVGGCSGGCGGIGASGDGGGGGSDGCCGGGCGGCGGD